MFAIKSMFYFFSSNNCENEQGTKSSNGTSNRAKKSCLMRRGQKSCDTVFVKISILRVGAGIKKNKKIKYEYCS